MIYKGYKYQKENGYFKRVQNGKTVYLHREIYKDHYGGIPEGMEIHHKDHDKSNNNPSNLEALTPQQHRQHHEEHLTDEQRELRRLNLELNARPAASKWHGSEEGLKFHREHYQKYKNKLHHKVKRLCNFCSSAFKTPLKNTNAFCSNKCKSAYRRASGVDLINRICVVCLAEFKNDKYSKQRTCSRKCGNKLRARTIRESSGKSRCV